MSWKKYAPVGIAAAIAAAIIFWPKKKAHAMPVGPPADEEDVPEEGGGGGGGGGGGARPPAAPAFFPDQNMEAATANANFAEYLAVWANSGNNAAAARQAYGVPSSRTVPGVIADRTFREVYPSAPFPIPKNWQQSSGYQPIVDAWYRIYRLLKRSCTTESCGRF